jgi:hypothetical protein
VVLRVFKINFLEKLGKKGNNMMKLTSANAQQLALEFFLEDWEIPEDDRDFFIPLSSHRVNDR